MAAAATPAVMAATTTAAEAAPAKVLYVFAHPDDEVLQAAPDIIEHVKAGLHVTVHAMTGGGASGARTRKVAYTLGYTPTVEEFMARRRDEFMEATRIMGVPVANAKVLGYADGGLTRSQVKGSVRAFLAANPGARVKGHSLFDGHRDHRNIGKALDEMHSNGEIADLRLFKPQTRVHQAPAYPRGGVQRRNADVAREAQWPYRHVDLGSRRWGVGYQSTSSLFDQVHAEPRADWHVPTKGGWRSTADRLAAESWVSSVGGYS
jgi:LmbE family N-acetylglucosaminyl deacetylase